MYATAPTNSSRLVQSLSRRPRISCAGIDAQVLDPAAAGGVAGDVQRECPTMPQLEATVSPDDQGCEAEAPQRLVEERWVVGRDVLVPRQPVVLVDA